MIGFRKIDHVLISIPSRTKAAARKFYMEILQLKEISGIHPRGAIWFEIGDIQLHIREEEGHKADSDRHSAFVVNDLTVAKNFLKQQQIPISYSSEIDGRDRCFFRDPWGNRFELITYRTEANAKPKN